MGSTDDRRTLLGVLGATTLALALMLAGTVSWSAALSAGLLTLLGGVLVFRAGVRRWETVVTDAAAECLVGLDALLEQHARRAPGADPSV